MSISNSVRFLLALTLLTAGLRAEDAADKKVKKYEGYGITLEYPAEMKIEETKETAEIGLITLEFEGDDARLLMINFFGSIAPKKATEIMSGALLKQAKTFDKTVSMEKTVASKRTFWGAERDGYKLDYKVLTMTHLESYTVRTNETTFVVSMIHSDDEAKTAAPLFDKILATVKFADVKKE